jgi:hypothetical protein
MLRLDRVEMYRAAKLLLVHPSLHITLLEVIQQAESGSRIPVLEPSRSAVSENRMITKASTHPGARTLAHNVTGAANRVESCSWTLVQVCSGHRTITKA